MKFQSVPRIVISSPRHELDIELKPTCCSESLNLDNLELIVKNDAKRHWQRVQLLLLARLTNAAVEGFRPSKEIEANNSTLISSATLIYHEPLHEL